MSERTTLARDGEERRSESAEKIAAVAASAARSDGVSIGEVVAALADYAGDTSDGGATAETVDTTPITADADDGTDDPYWTCEVCGFEAETPSAKGGHRQNGSCPNAGDTSDDAGDTNDGGDGSGMTVSDPSEIKSAVEQFTERQAENYVSKFERDPAAGDADPWDSLAKAMVDHFGGEPEHYTAAFGPCECSDCDRGANGLRADRCMVCQKRNESDGADDESSESDGPTIRIET